MLPKQKEIKKGQKRTMICMNKHRKLVFAKYIQSYSSIECHAIQIISSFAAIINTVKSLLIVGLLFSLITWST